MAGMLVGVVVPGASSASSASIESTARVGCGMVVAVIIGIIATGEGVGVAVGGAVGDGVAVGVGVAVGGAVGAVGAVNVSRCIEGAGASGCAADAPTLVGVGALSSPATEGIATQPCTPRESSKMVIESQMTERRAGMQCASSFICATASRQVARLVPGRRRQYARGSSEYRDSQCSSLPPVFRCGRRC